MLCTCISMYLINPLTCIRSKGLTILVGLAVCRSIVALALALVCVSVRMFSLRPWLWWIQNVDMFNGRMAQQESGVALLKNRVFTMGGLNVQCVHLL